MPAIRLPALRRQLAAIQPAGRVTVQDAHARLDLVELSFDALTAAVEQAASGQADLTRSVGELTTSVSRLQSVTGQTQDSLKTFVADTKDGRDMLAKMIAEVIEKKTGSWTMWLGAAAIASSPNWLPKLFEILRVGIAGHA